MKKSKNLVEPIVVIHGPGKDCVSVEHAEAYWRSLANGAQFRFEECRPEWHCSSNQSHDLIVNTATVEKWIDERGKNERIRIVCLNAAGLPAIAREAITYSRRSPRQKFEVCTIVPSEDGSVARTVYEYL